MSDKYILDGQTTLPGFEEEFGGIESIMPKTKESAIDYLNEIGWLPEHDKILSPKEGSWVKSDKYNGYLVCSVCGDCYVDSDWISSEKWKYCPSCGAHMSYDEQEIRNV